MRSPRLSPAGFTARLLLAAAAVVVSACENFEPPAPSEPAGAAAGGGMDPGAATGGDTAPPGSPPDSTDAEPADDALVLGESAGGGRYVFAADPHSGTTAILEPATLEARFAEAGRSPTYLGAHPDHDLAVVLEADRARAHVVWANSGATGSDSVDVVAGANRAEVAPDGRHAVVFVDADRGDGNSSQELSVLALRDEPPSASTVSVGRAPSSVHFSADGATALVHTADGLYRVQLDSAGGVAERLAFDTDRDLAAQVAAPDAELGLAFSAGSSELLGLSTDSDDRGSVDLADHPDVPTGVAITHLAVSGDDGQVWVVLQDGDTTLVLAGDLPEVFTDPGGASVAQLGGAEASLLVAGEVTGSALLVATRDGQPTAYALSSAAPNSPVRVTLSADVTGAWLSASGRGALLTHAGGYTALNVEAPLAKFRATANAPTAALIPEGQEQGFVAVASSEGTAARLDRVDFDTLAVQSLELSSDPGSLGSVVDASVSFVDQLHPDGRLSFVPWGNDAPRTVTGYRIPDRVRE